MKQNEYYKKAARFGAGLMQGAKRLLSILFINTVFLKEGA
jgi:hypothetical protein